jgi:hypothetical protein
VNGLNQVSGPIILMPAYGRTYSTSAEAVMDWKAGKDFKIMAGPYCSIRDLDKLGASSVWVDLVTTVVRLE